MEGECHGQRRTTWSQCKGVKPPDIHGRLPAVCGQKARACSTVFDWERSFGSGKKTAYAAVHEWLRVYRQRVKGKEIPLQAWTGPEDSRRLRLPDFKTLGT